MPFDRWEGSPTKRGYRKGATAWGEGRLGSPGPCPLTVPLPTFTSFTNLFYQFLPTSPPFTVPFLVGRVPRLKRDRTKIWYPYSNLGGPSREDEPVSRFGWSLFFVASRLEVGVLCCFLGVIPFRIPCLSHLQVSGSLCSHVGKKTC